MSFLSARQEGQNFREADKTTKVEPLKFGPINVPVDVHWDGFLELIGGLCYDFYPTLHFFPFLVFTFHRSLGDICTLLSLHIFQLLLIAYSDAAMHSLLTYAPHTYLCAALLYSI